VWVGERKMIEKFRVFRVDHVDYGYYSRYSLKKPLSVAVFRAFFKIPKTSKVTPLLDKRMKNGGRVEE
jgi:hypothetical protein